MRDSPDSKAYIHVDGDASNTSATEYLDLVSRIGRSPTDVEVAVVHSLWSEHCSYKSSRAHFHHFPTTSRRSLVGPGENAGALDIGDGWAVVFKIESHNHPSAIEPYQGAMTGVGGILRDVFTMGARPLALLNSLRFGDLSHSATSRLVRGVVSGIGAYGNCVGIPTVGGQVAFDSRFSGNNLVNVFCIGLMRHGQMVRGAAEGVGNAVVLLGSLTGKDGVLGAVMASSSFGDSIGNLRPAVQVGDPLMGKQVMECCLDLFHHGLVVGAQDLGAAGLSSAAFEMANRARTGLRLDLDHVPMRTNTLTAKEILLSESQERMLLVVAPKHLAEVHQICRHFEVPSATVGVVTDTGRVEARFRGETVLDLPVFPIITDAPMVHRPWVRPSPGADSKTSEPTPQPSVSIKDALVGLLSHPDFAAKRWVYEQFDSTVGNRTAVGPGRGAAVMLVPQSRIAIAVSLTCDSHYCTRDPYLGAFHAVFEGARKVSCAGAEPIGISDNLNFGDPNNPEIMGQLVESIRGIADACRALEIPVCSGNVSLFNQTGDVAIPPTPTIAMVGLVNQIDLVLRPGFKTEGHIIMVIGSMSRHTPYLTGYSRVLHSDFSVEVPQVDVKAELSAMRVVRDCLRKRWLDSASSCGRGGLLIALAKESFRSESGGFRIALPPDVDPVGALFGEGSGRFVVSVSPNNTPQVQAHCEAANVQATVMGWVQPNRFTVVDHLDVERERIQEAWMNGLGPNPATGGAYGR